MPVVFTAGPIWDGTGPYCSVHICGRHKVLILAAGKVLTSRRGHDHRLGSVSMGQANLKASPHGLGPYPPCPPPPDGVSCSDSPQRTCSHIQSHIQASTLSHSHIRDHSHSPCTITEQFYTVWDPPAVSGPPGYHHQTPSLNVTATACCRIITYGD